MNKQVDKLMLIVVIYIILMVLIVLFAPDLFSKPIFQFP